MSKYKDIGLLITRIGVGLMYIYHGYSKFFGGPDTWESVGAKMAYLGIDFFPVFWGFMASASEFLGGFLLIIGFTFRPACFFMFFTMFVASVYHLASGDGLGGASHAIELAFVFVGLFFIGPGRYSIDK